MCKHAYVYTIQGEIGLGSFVTSHGAKLRDVQRFVRVDVDAVVSRAFQAHRPGFPKPQLLNRPEIIKVLYIIISYHTMLYHIIAIVYHLVIEE